MPPEIPDPKTQAVRLDTIIDPLEKSDLRVCGLGMRQIVEAQEFVMQDGRGEVRARLEMPEYSPRLTFSDRLGEPRLLLPPLPRRHTRPAGLHGAWRLYRSACSLCRR